MICPCGVNFVPTGADFPCSGKVLADGGFIAAGITGVDGEVEMVREGGGKVKLTFKGGIVTAIEDEA